MLKQANEVIKISKYGQSIGIWELKVGGADLKLHPKMGDNYALMSILTQQAKRGDTWVMSEITNFTKRIIERDYPPVSDNEREELNLYVEMNLMDIMKETLIAFRWAKREDLDKTQKADLLKKVGLQVQSEEQEQYLN